MCEGEEINENRRRLVFCIKESSLKGNRCVMAQILHSTFDGAIVSIIGNMS